MKEQEGPIFCCVWMLVNMPLKVETVFPTEIFINEIYAFLFPQRLVKALSPPIFTTPTFKFSKLISSDTLVDAMGPCLVLHQLSNSL